MEITQDNFKQALPIIEKSVKNCDFISIDTEFSGLELPGDDSCSLFDSPSERYAKYKRAVSAFTLMQIGVSCFKKHPELNKYETQVFNIFVFPSSFGEYGTTFSAQISSIDFLCRNRFDFNKFVYEGVPFLNRRGVEIARSSLISGQVDWREIGASEFSDSCQLLTTWLANAGAGDSTELDVSNIPTETGKRILEYELQRIFPQIRITRSTTNPVKVTVAFCEDAALRKRNLQVLLQKILDELVGCAVLFDILASAKKPIVGQNMLLDLMFLYEKFYDQLPDRYDDFKENLRNLLPQVYDTKQVAVAMRKILEERGCKSFSLDGMYQFFEGNTATRHVVQYQPHVALLEGYKKYETEQCPHEAGFDSFICGVVFLRLAHMKAVNSMISSTNLTEPLPYHKHIEAVGSVVNRVSLINASISHLNLNGPDPTSLRPDWLFLKSTSSTMMSGDGAGGFRPKLDRSRLMADLSVFGSFDVRHVSRNGALIAVASHNAVQAILENPQMRQRYSIRRYNSSSLRASYGKVFALSTALVAFGVLACAWTWKAVSSTGRRNIIMN